MAHAKRLIRALIPRKVRNYLRSPAKTVEWIWGEAQYRMGANKVVQMRPDWQIRCHPAAYKFAYHLQDDDPEQVAEFDSFIANCHEGMILFDVGAHFGLFSLAALHYGGPSAKAIAVDPSPTASRIMRIQAQLNHLVNQLEVIQASAGDKTGYQSMVAVGILAGGYFVAPTSEHTESELTQTREVTIDSLACDFNALPTHIKIDVEGFESSVIQGGRKVLSGLKAPLLFVELHNQMVRDRGGDPADTLTMIAGLGYGLFTVDGTPTSRDRILSRPLTRIIASKSIG